MGDVVGGLYDSYIKLFNTILGNGILEHALTLGGHDGIFDSVFDWAAKIANMLIIIYGMWEINTNWTQAGEISPKVIAFPLIKYGIAATLIQSMGAIRLGLISLYKAEAKIEKVSLVFASTTADPDADPTRKAIVAEADSNLFEGLLMMLVLLLLWIVSLVVAFIFIYKAYAIGLEFYARMAGLPLAMADSFSGISSPALRYIKGSLAFIGYVMAFTVLPKAMTIIGKDAMTAFADPGQDPLSLAASVGTALIIPIATIGALDAIKQVLKEAAS